MAISLDYEKSLGGIVLGIDEAGRGPLAGGVFAAAVSMPLALAEALLVGAWSGVNDSKKLTAKKREQLSEIIRTTPGCIWAVATATPAEIDRLNILHATHLAMRRAAEGVLAKVRAEGAHILVDGLPVPDLPVPSQNLVKGDAKSLFIAAASILAKTARDKDCLRLETAYPGYGFAKHKGYPTPEHLAALNRLGPCPEHRRSFGPVMQMTLFSLLACVMLPIAAWTAPAPVPASRPKTFAKARPGQLQENVFGMAPQELVDLARQAPAAIDVAAKSLQEFGALASQVFFIMEKSSRVAFQRHQRQVAQGVVEVPASQSACKYRITVAGHSFVFDQWGELFLDRRDMSPEEMDVVRDFETKFRQYYERQMAKRLPPSGRPPAEGEVLLAAARLPTRAEALKKVKVPFFRGFEDARYQQHDKVIVKLVDDFNAHKAAWIGGTAEQAAKVPNLTYALVKSHMIEETGGNGPMSKNAWRVDPQQINVPGDWDDAKADLGIAKPQKRNEGKLEDNVRAAIKFLSRKGFGISGRAAKKRPTGFFDGWLKAFQRYNARRDRTLDNRYYSEAYADKIRERAEKPLVFVPIEIRLASPKAESPAVPVK